MNALGALQVAVIATLGVSRNPIYLALDLLAVSAFAMSGSVYFLVSGLAVVSGIHVQILREERFLVITGGFLSRSDATQLLTDCG